MGQCTSLPSPAPPIPTHVKLFQEFQNLSAETKAILARSINEVCSDDLNQWADRKEWWSAYRAIHKDDLTAFFESWLTYCPVPDGTSHLPNVEHPTGVPNSPSYYIEKWDWIANTTAGLSLTGFDDQFRSWFIQFLDAHGDFLKLPESSKTLKLWYAYHGSNQHPFDINDYEVPKGGFKTFNTFFLRFIKKGLREVSESDKNNKLSIVSPSDGGIFKLVEDGAMTKHYVLPSKRGDTFHLDEAFPGYGQYFVGGPLLDTLLWFTDFHHFFAPVSGKVIAMSEYPGSYNYDFEDFDPFNTTHPKPDENSDKVGWYKKLATHKRYVWIIKTESLGLVGMAAIGFFGVGSIVVDDKDKTTWPKGVKPVVIGNEIKKGQYLGHFGYGGSSIILAFQPKVNGQQLTYDLKVEGQPILSPDEPTQVKARQHIATVSIA